MINKIISKFELCINELEKGNLTKENLNNLTAVYLNLKKYYESEKIESIKYIDIKDIIKFCEDYEYDIKSIENRKGFMFEGTSKFIEIKTCKKTGKVSFKIEINKDKYNVSCKIEGLEKIIINNIKEYILK